MWGNQGIDHLAKPGLLGPTLCGSYLIATAAPVIGSAASSRGSSASARSSTTSFQLGDKQQGYLNLKVYGEFANENRPAGWNLWLTFKILPAAATPPTPSRPMFTK